MWHGKVWCGADQAKKQAPHLKTGSPLLAFAWKWLVYLLGSVWTVHKSCHAKGGEGGGGLAKHYYWPPKPPFGITFHFWEMLNFIHGPLVCMEGEQSSATLQACMQVNVEFWSGCWVFYVKSEFGQEMETLEHWWALTRLCPPCQYSWLKDLKTLKNNFASIHQN